MAVDALPTDIRYECQWDARPETRELVMNLP